MPSDEPALVVAYLVLQNLVLLCEGEHVVGEAFDIHKVISVGVEDCQVLIFSVWAATESVEHF